MDSAIVVYKIIETIVVGLVGIELAFLKVLLRLEIAKLYLIIIVNSVKNLNSFWAFWEVVVGKKH